MELVTTDDLRKAAFSLMPYIASVMPNAADQQVLLQGSLDASMIELEEELETFFAQRVIRQTTPADGDVYDVVEAPHNYHSGSLAGGRLPSYTLRRRPVVSIQHVYLQFNDANRVLEIPQTWWKVNYRFGWFTFLPLGSAQFAAEGASWFLPLLGGRMNQLDLPHFVAFDYTAGWYDPEGTGLPREAPKLREGILHAARLHLCKEAMGIVPTSSSAGGVSQSFTAIEKQIEVLDKDLQAFRDWWNRHYRPPRVVML